MTEEGLRRAEPKPQAAVMVSPRAAEAPGRLRGEAWLVLHTRDAYRLALGRAAAEGRPRILGLAAFAGLTAIIDAAARLDDPYADWWLWRIEQAHHAARATLQELQEALAQRLRMVAGIEIGATACTAPARLPLRASTPFAGAAALLLADYDRLMLGALGARHYGLIDRAAFGRLRDRAGHGLRRLFAAAAGYRDCGVTREDFRAGTARAEAARERLGEPPEAILSGRERAALAPEILAGRHLCRPSASGSLPQQALAPAEECSPAPEEASGR